MIKKLPIHELAELFPPADNEDREKLRKSLEEQGQMEAIIVYEGKVLDGANRQAVLVDDLGIAPRYMEFSELPEANRAAGPLAYVMARNMARRHLTPSQKAAIATEALPLFEREAAERQRQAGLAQKEAKPSVIDEHDQRPPVEAEEESQAPMKKGKAAAQAAKAFGVSTSSVERAKALKKRDPKKFADVKAGKVKLNKAAKNADKEAKAKAEFEEALKRIAKILGRKFREGIESGAILKGQKRDVLELAKMSDGDMQKVKGLLEHGWKLQKARGYKQTALTASNTLRDLGTRAIAKGAATGTAFTMPLEIEGVALEISVRAAKQVTAKPAE